MSVNTLFYHRNPNIRDGQRYLLDQPIPLWPQYDSDNGHYLSIEFEMTNASVGSHYAKERMAAMEAFYRDVLVSSYPNGAEGNRQITLVSLFCLATVTMIYNMIYLTLH